MTTGNERIAEIEVLFRAGNDRISGWPEHQELMQSDERLVFLCECGDRTCSKPLRLTGAEYEHVRSDARWFVLATGHELLEAEDVIERHDGYLVVQKHEDVRELVERLSLRAR